jgi:hypothetical protein
MCFFGSRIGLNLNVDPYRSYRTPDHPQLTGRKKDKAAINGSTESGSAYIGRWRAGRKGAGHGACPPPVEKGSGKGGIALPIRQTML